MQIRLDRSDPDDVVLARSRNAGTVWLNGKPHRSGLRAAGRAYEVWLDDQSERMWLAVDRDNVYVHAFGRAWKLEVLDPAEIAPDGQNQADVATAPMPGVVQEVTVVPGEAVQAGQTLVVIESMKMQSEIIAWRDGTVAKIHLAVGTTFDRGADLVALQPESTLAP